MQKKKYYSNKIKTKPASDKTYFKAKAKTISPEKMAKKSAAKSASKNAKKTLKSAQALISSTRAKADKQVLSNFFISSDMANQSTHVVATKHKQNFEKTIALPKLNTGLVEGMTGRKRITRLDALKRAIMLFIRKMQSWFSSHRHQMHMTISGRRALAQLEDLYNLLSLEAIDESSLMQLKVAYGEACYYIMQASRGYHQKHGGKGKERYQPYFDRFVDAGTN
ncbi:MAG: hypothetical protein WC492_00400 [Candidatus Micrarchaeia archaeon]